MNNKDECRDQQKPAAIILAAGRGSRFGGDKLMAKLPSGERIIDLVMNKTTQVFDDYCCVVRNGDVELQQYLDKKQWRWTVAHHASKGMSQSLICGVDAFPMASGWLFVLADMPYLLPSTLIKLRKSLVNDINKPRISIPCHTGKTGNPIGLSKHFKCELKKLTGDVGARSIVEQHRYARMLVDVEDSGIFHDIDHPHDILN